ncbi:MAG: TIGR01777 family oxidoreductase [Bacteroidales bacterium]
MKIIVFGGSGFIGSHLIPKLVEEGHQVVLFSRYPERTREKFSLDQLQVAQWDGFSDDGLKKHANGSDVVINLAGEDISSKPWTQRQRFKIRQSRSQLGTTIAMALEKLENRPSLYIQASAIGIYGPQPGLACDETSSLGIGFLADVTKAWEKPAELLAQQGMRTAIIRTGIVLGLNGGLLQRMMIPFRFFVGGYPGNGKQSVSWIHIDDQVRAILHIIHHPTSHGVYNLTAPQPTTMKKLARLLGKKMKRPAWFPIPAWSLKMVFGQMAREVLLADQFVLPMRLTQEEFTFRHTDVKEAMDDLFASKNQV